MRVEGNVIKKLIRYVRTTSLESAVLIPVNIQMLSPKKPLGTVCMMVSLSTKWSVPKSQTICFLSLFAR